LLVGARPRGPGMERKDLLLANAQIFSAQGKAMNEVADRNIKVLVVGNPANTNSLIARANAPDLNPRNFTAMTRLDHNRAKSQLAKKAGVTVNDITNLTIWGNHSATQYPDIFHAKIKGRNAAEVVDDQAWLEGDFIPTVAKRGAAIIEARGSSGVNGTVAGDWVSAAIVSDGSYGVPEGIISSFPVTASGGEWEIVQGLEIDAFSRARIDASVAELVDERNAVTELGLI
jgi:malate dehydrogenase